LRNVLVLCTVLITSGPNGLNLGHITSPHVVAGFVAIRRRWTPALGALLGAIWLPDAIFLTDLLVQSDSAPPSPSPRGLYFRSRGSWRAKV
jgi:hypothetical protein